MAVQEQWPYLLEPGLREVFNVQYAALAAESKIPLLFRTITSNKAYEYFLGMGGMADWSEYKGKIDFDEMEELYRTTFTHKEFVQAFTVERKLVDDDQYNVISARPAALALAAARTREKHAASVFNNAFNSSYKGGDSVALCSDSHPKSPGNSASVQDNNGTLSLSYSNLNTVRQLMRAFTDDRGELIPIMPDTLLIPPELEETARSIVLTPNMVDTADQHYNFVGSFIKQVIVWDYLTDSNAWFVIDSKLAKQYLLWLDRVPIEFAVDPTGDFNLKAKYRGYMRYSYGFSDWRWVYGNNPS